MAGPFFSVLITTYNRARLVERCVRSTTQQTFPDFEIVVVDDGSTDATAEVLAGLDEPRLKVVHHQQNRGISPSRATAVNHAAGEWFVMVDSDDELVPHALARLRTLIDELPDGVRIIRSRLRRDDGAIEPGILPAGVTGYHERMSWLEAIVRSDVSSDAGHCMHRSVFKANNYIDDRRGVMEGVWELDLARRESSLWVSDILGLHHLDAPNSHTHDASETRLIPRMLGEAPDSLWAHETILAEHGAALARYAPNLRHSLVTGAALQAFLAGDRPAGIRHTRAALRSHPLDLKLGATFVLGILGPPVLAHAKLAGRRWRAWWKSR